MKLLKLTLFSKMMIPMSVSRTSILLTWSSWTLYAGAVLRRISVSIGNVNKSFYNEPSNSHISHCCRIFLPMPNSLVQSLFQIVIGSSTFVYANWIFRNWIYRREYWYHKQSYKVLLMLIMMNMKLLLMSMIIFKDVTTAVVTIIILDLVKPRIWGHFRVQGLQYPLERWRDSEDWKV